MKLCDCPSGKLRNAQVPRSPTTNFWTEASALTAAPYALNRLAQYALFFTLLGMATVNLAQAPIIQPGLPGDPARELSAEEAIEIADTSYSPAGAQFMQEWLRERGERVREASDHDAMRTDHRMAGMATPQKMTDLAAADGAEFGRLLLQLMITHHDGAVTMVEELLEQPGAAYDPVLFEFRNDVSNGQTAEIERMNVLLVGLSDDPRASLSAGFDDAGQGALR